MGPRVLPFSPYWHRLFPIWETVTAFQTHFGGNSPPSSSSEHGLWVFLASDHLLVGLGRESWPETWCEFTWLFMSKTAGVLGVLWVQAEQGSLLSPWKCLQVFSPNESSRETQPRGPRTTVILWPSGAGPCQPQVCHQCPCFIAGVWCVMGRGAY